MFVNYWVKLNESDKFSTYSIKCSKRLELNRGQTSLIDTNSNSYYRPRTTIDDPAKKNI